MTERKFYSKFVGKTILLVDDDEAVRLSISQILKKLGFTVIEADTGATARSLLVSKRFDIVLSDIRMPDMTGIDLLHHVRRSQSNYTPFILMTGFSDVMEAREAFNIGADQFLPKPFQRDELLNAIDLIIGQHEKKSSDPKADDLNFCKISLEEFTSSSKLKVDVFLQLSKQKYLRVATQSSDLSQERIIHYKSKGLTHLYIRREDFSKYVDLNLKVSRAASKAGELSNQRKFQVLKHAAEVIVQDSYANGLDRVKFNEAAETVDLVLETMARDNDLLSLAESLNSSSNFLYAHSLGVSLYSSLIAQELGWKSAQEKLKIAMGGLLHDFGKKELDQVLLKKPRRDLDRQGVATLESHPLRGSQLLSKTQSVPPEVVRVAQEHHENCLGSGYPLRLTREEIHPFSRLVALANRFCEEVLNGVHVVTYSPEEAINRILTYNANIFDPVCLIALMKIFNHPRLPGFIIEIKESRGFKAS